MIIHDITRLIVLLIFKKAVKSAEKRGVTAFFECGKKVLRLLPKYDTIVDKRGARHGKVAKNCINYMCVKF